MGSKSTRMLLVVTSSAIVVYHIVFADSVVLLSYALSCVIAVSFSVPCTYSPSSLVISCSS